MILLVSVFITDKKLYSKRISNKNDRLAVFKYTLASYSVLPISKAIIFCELDKNYSSQQESLKQYIHSIFKQPIVYFHRFTTKQQWINSKIFDTINGMDDKLVWFTQNDDHVFIDSNLDVVEEGIKLLQNDNKVFSSLCFSHTPEHLALGCKLKAKKVGKYHIVFGIPMTDSIQIFSKKYLIYLLKDYRWPTKSMIRIDNLIRDTRIWGKHGTKKFNMSVNVYVPLKEICRHFDGYDHVEINPTICPPLFIPKGFFQKQIVIKYCNKSYDENCVNINPLKIIRKPLTPIDKRKHTDMNIILEDIPLFWLWNGHIGSIITELNISDDKLRRSRDIHFNKLINARHNNWWTDGIQYNTPDSWDTYIEKKQIRICLSIKNRGKDLINLIQLINTLYNIYPNITVHVTDFMSNDVVMKVVLDKLGCEYEINHLDEPFNLGKGWNNSCNMSTIDNKDILLFLTNDVHIKNIRLFLKMMKNNTILNKSVFAPEHLCETRHKRYSYKGGATLFAVYKQDFIKMGLFSESTEWGMAGRRAEDGDFFDCAKRCGFKLYQKKDNNIIAKWHKRDFQNPWYYKSKKAATMVNKQHWRQI